MMPAIGQQFGQHGQAGRSFRASLLVFVLLLLHLALMTTEHHDASQHEQHGAIGNTVAAIASLVPLPLAPHGEHDMPRSTLDGCPVGVAVLPLLFALLVLVATALGGRAPTIQARARVAPIARLTLPPPLAAPQRRALLQVFLI